MNRNPRTMNRNLLIAVILSVGLNDVSSGAASPAIASMIDAFPETSVTAIQLIVTLPNLIVVFLAPVYAWLSSKIQPRKIILAALVIFIFGGAMPAFADDIKTIIIYRALLGIGSGVTIPAAISLIPVYFEGKLRDKLIGWNMATGCFGAIVMQTAAGYLTLISWRYCFLAYLFSLWVLILVFLFLPDVPKTPARNELGGRRLTLRAYGLVAAYLLITILICTMTTNISIVLEGEGIGNASHAGVALSLFTLGALGGSLFFGRLKSLFKAYIIALAWLTVGLGYCIFCLAQTVPAFYTAAFVAGVGLGNTVAGYYARMTELSPEGAATLGIALIAASQGLGNFIQPMVTGAVVELLGQDFGRFPVMLAAAGAVCGAGILAVTQALSNKKRSLETAP